MTKTKRTSLHNLGTKRYDRGDRRLIKRFVARALAAAGRARARGWQPATTLGRRGMPQDLAHLVKTEASRDLVRREWRGTPHRERGRHRARWERLRAQEKAIVASASVSA